jgi:hypothetical protein
MSLKLESNAKTAMFKPAQLDDSQQYVVLDLGTQNSVTALGKDLNAESLSKLAGNKSSWIVEIRPTQARL